MSIGLPGVFMSLSDAAQRALAADMRPDGRPRIPPGQLAVEMIRDMGGTPGTATAENWRLRVHGEVENPVVLTYKDLFGLEQVDTICDIHCVTGWTLLNSRWTGVRLSTILDKVRPRKSAGFIIFEAPAGYTSNIPIADTRNENVILAHSFFGKKLPREYGAPVRALVPDRYFYKSAKWIEAIRVSARDEPGFWETQGYSNTADPWTEDRFGEESEEDKGSPQIF